VDDGNDGEGRAVDARYVVLFGSDDVDRLAVDPSRSNDHRDELSSSVRGSDRRALRAARPEAIPDGMAAEEVAEGNADACRVLHHHEMSRVGNRAALRVREP
jgi:hypothetical protein